MTDDEKRIAAMPLNARRRVLLHHTFAIVFAVALCHNGAGAQSGTSAAPSWYTKPPVDARFWFARATTTSKDKQTAIDKATQDARTQIAGWVRSRLDSVRRSAEQEQSLEGNAAGHYNAAAQSIAVALKGSRIRNQKATKKKGIYTAYVLVEYPIAASSEGLAGSIRADELLQPLLGPTAAFAALEKEAAAYRSSLSSGKKKQQR